MATTNPITTAEQSVSSAASAVKTAVQTDIAKVEAVESGLSRTTLFWIGAAFGLVVGVVATLIL